MMSRGSLFMSILDSIPSGWSGNTTCSWLSARVGRICSILMRSKDGRTIVESAFAILTNSGLGKFQKIGTGCTG